VSPHRTLLRLLRHGRLPLAVTLALGLVGGLLAVPQAYLVADTLDRVFLRGGSRDDVAGALALLLLTVFLRAACTGGAESAAGRLAARVKGVVRDRLVSSWLNQPPLGTRPPAGEVAHLLGEGVEPLDPYLAQLVPQAVQAAVIPAAIVAIVLPVDLLSGVVLLVTAPVVPLFMVLVGKMARARTEAQWTATARMSAYFLDVLQGMTTLRLLGQGRQACDRVERVGDQVRDATLGVLKVSFLSALVLEWAATLGTAVVAVQVGLRLLHGHVEFAPAFFVLLLAPEVFQPLRALGARFHAGMAGVTAAERLSGVLGAPPPPPPARLPSSPPPSPPVVFDDVTVGYPDRSAPALDRLSLTLHPGQHVALVGPSGSGKSTVAHLLLGLLHPASGRVRVGDLDLRDVAPEAWRGQVAWVPQTPAMLHDTVEANIRLGRPDASRDDVEEAARLACAHPFIEQLPDGYSTVVGEGAARLSAGQAQRVALARALLRDTPVLVLDEATSHLDGATEAQVLRNLAGYARGRTVLSITHRDAVVRVADRVVALEAGRFVSAVASPGVLDAPVTEPLSTPTAVSPEPRAATQVTTTELLWKTALPHAPAVAGAVLLGVATVGASMGLMATATYLIAHAALHPSISSLQVAIVGVRFFGLLRGVARYAERLVSHGVTLRLLARLRGHFYRVLEPLTPARLTLHRGGDLLERVTADITSLEGLFVRGLAPPLVALVVTVTTCVIMTGWSHLVAGTVLLLAVLTGVVTPWLVHAVGRRWSVAVAEGRSRLTQQAVEVTQGLPEITVCGALPSLVSRARETAAAVATGQARLADVSGLQAALVTACSLGSLWVVLLVGIPLVRDGAWSGPALAVAALVAVTMFEAVQPLPVAAQSLATHVRAASRLSSLAATPPAVVDPSSPAPLATPSHLEARGLTFRYPDGTPGILDVDLDVATGRKVAVVGSSGAGKSTLLSVLVRFWDHQGGRLGLDGVDVRACRADDVRACFAVVPQTAHLFTGTLRDNLLLAQPADSDDRLRETLHRVGLGPWLASAPRGLDTWVGEQGHTLSGGERQRLAWARALLRDAPFLLLDEPTSHLDDDATRGLMALLRDTPQGVLLVTHALPCPQDWDEVVVMDGGRVTSRRRGSATA
jgi:ATP-binding cassette subfamily C protein CydCD